MSNNRAQQRLQALFVDIERLSTDPRADTAEMKREIEGLRARLCELEKVICNDHGSETFPERGNGSVASAPTVDVKPSRFQLYEKDKVTYVFSNGKLETLPISNQVPAVQHAIASPLTAGGQVIGEVQIVPPADHELTADELTLTNAITQQASLQIQNLRLLAEAERSLEQSIAVSPKYENGFFRLGEVRELRGNLAGAEEAFAEGLAKNPKSTPLAFRLALLKGKPRHAKALEIAADKAGWGKPPPAGRARGLAVHESFGSIVAEVASWGDTHLRAAYSQSLGGAFFDQSVRLEPVQLAGFNQAFRSLVPESVAGLVPGPRFETFGAGIDQKIAPTRTYLLAQGEILRSLGTRTVGILTNNVLGPAPLTPDQAAGTPQRSPWATASISPKRSSTWPVPGRSRSSSSDRPARISRTAGGGIGSGACAERGPAGFEHDDRFFLRYAARHFGESAAIL